jgi:hypothetical protein
VCSKCSPPLGRAGRTEAILMAHGFTVDLLAGLRPFPQRRRSRDDPDDQPSLLPAGKRCMISVGVKALTEDRQPRFAQEAAKCA